jgi:hypothetical protein
MKTVTITITEDQFDQIVRLISNARSNATLEGLTFKDHLIPDLAAYGVANMVEVSRLSKLMDAIHTNRIVRGE